MLKRMQFKNSPMVAVTDDGGRIGHVELDIRCFEPLIFTHIIVVCSLRSHRPLSLENSESLCA